MGGVARCRGSSSEVVGAVRALRASSRRRLGAAGRGWCRGGGWERRGSGGTQAGLGRVGPTPTADKSRRFPPFPPSRHDRHGYGGRHGAAIPNPPRHRYSVLRKKPDFRRKPWPTISNAAKDFVKKLLVKDPRARLTAAQALSHPWVREGGEALEIPIDISVLSNMRQFVKYSRFKQFALRALASTLNEEELADIKDQFDAIDVDKNGSISLEEMRQVAERERRAVTLYAEGIISSGGMYGFS
ncbi:Calcium-dependent protein kinase 16 [Glycine soja]|uniref:Calcium-dependent protein kinase 16 n=1 Tax=Glycine soja TaxID=3848 RepID=A0A445GHY5_GLYSO|nr:Calcium-dependent protein kinase 16 [Glycine soja]